MAEVELWCATYGDACVFSVTIARDATVEKLQEVICKEQRYDHNYTFAASELTLHLAKKSGAWMTDDQESEDFLKESKHCSTEHPFARMWPSTMLNDEANLGPDFEPGEKEVHVLVDLPEGAVRVVWLPVGMDCGAKRLIAPYKQVATRLKDDPTVTQLVAAVRYVAADTRTRQFIVLETSTGMGKTQMAFNLMEREELEVFYLVCTPPRDHGLPLRRNASSAFSGRCETFLECIKGDLSYESYETLQERFPGVGRGEMLDAPTGLCLQTFEFVRALLSGTNVKRGAVCSYEKVAELIEGQTKQPVIFLDEFPAMEGRQFVKLRFMRNVFRTLQLPLIISSRDKTARELCEKGDFLGDTDRRWCIVVPEMPRFQDPALETLSRDDVAALVRHSRPQFARYALEYIMEHELPSEDDDEQTIRYMDELTQDVGARYRSSQRPFEMFRIGQMNLFRSVSQYQQSPEQPTGLSGAMIDYHFARLRDRTMFELRLNDNHGLVKVNLEERDDGSLVGKEPRHPRCWHAPTVNPSLDQDVLLYMCMMGGKYHRTVVNGRGEYVSICAALKGFMTSPLDMNNPHQPTNDGKLLATMTIGGFVSASHCNGFAGIPLDAFLLEVAYELGWGRPATDEDWCSAIPASFRSRAVPFLAPPDAQWPAWLPSALNVGSMALASAGNDPYDLQIDNGWLTGECEGRCNVLKMLRMKNILSCIQPRSAVHVVVTNQLQASYFTYESFKVYLVTKCPHLRNTLFLQWAPGERIRPVIGMKNAVCQPDRVVLFVAQSPPAVSQRRKLPTTPAVDENDQPTKKRRTHVGSENEELE